VIDTVQLSPDELMVLKEHFRKSQNGLIRERAQAILACCHEEFSILQISKLLLRNEKTIREWVKSYQKTGISSLFPRYKGDNAGKLSKQQKATLKAVLAKPPSDYGIPQKFWDISSLKQYIHAEFGVEYESKESYRLIFVLHNYSFHLPDTFDRHRDDAKVEKRVEEIKAEIAPLLTDEKWLVFTSDECRIIWESEIRRLWLPKGQKTVIKVERKRQAQSFIGFLNLKTGEDLLYRLAWQKQDEIIPVLEGLVNKYPNKRICIIWDNARFHHGRKLKAKLSTTLKAIHLINLPAYAPDHNPQEHVWKYGKDKLANNQRGSLEETIQAFESFIMSRNYPYHF
jgi:transposase